MEKYIIDNLGTLIMYGLFIAFQVGFIYKSFKGKTSKDDVYRIIETKLANHKDNCRYYPEDKGIETATKLGDIESNIKEIKNKIDQIFNYLLPDKK